MNFLAHFHLAWPDEGLVLGGLEGDFHKGAVDRRLPDGVARGVRLHRAIDAFTDEHPETRALRRHFPPRLRRFAGILIDLSFDHFLCRHWRQFSALEQAEFNRRIYALLASRETALSEPARHMFGHMRRSDLLGRYRHWETVGASAARIGERLRRGNPLRDAGTGLAPLRPALEQAFLRFYPELQRFVSGAAADSGPTSPAVALCGPNP